MLRALRPADPNEENKEWVDDDEELLEPNQCPMCERVMPLTRHHLIPKTTHKKYIKQGYDKDWLNHHVADICRPCHSGVHNIYSEETLAKSYHTLELLMADERIQAMIKYQKTQRVRITPGAHVKFRR
eukprot:TRINITY_DN7191_c0_g1_i3.p1 TRINITY_DN7191_c0_g1~~TRINITY_DN7191_c0_g1_i3.p1  ORF type:complete len:128 (-),score=17.89 TRINITY_DN7191_c0_g1_i3:167-550(-)